MNYSFKSYYRVFLLVLIFGALALFSACENPFQDEDENDDEDTGTAPRVLDAGVFPPGEPDSARLTTMSVGDSVELFVLIEDPDLDADTTTMVQNYPDDSSDEGEVTLDSQTDERMLYSFGGPVTVAEPTGTYRIELTPKDANGNIGNTFRFSFTVTD